MRRCSVAWCDQKHAARGYCGSHYRRWQKGADLQVTPQPSGQRAIDLAQWVLATYPELVRAVV